MAKYRAFIEMNFEPDENGYLEWEYAYDLDAQGLEEEDYKPRTEEEMKTRFADELYEFLSDYTIKLYDYIRVEKVAE